MILTRKHIDNLETFARDYCASENMEEVILELCFMWRKLNPAEWLSPAEKLELDWKIQHAVNGAVSNTLTEIARYLQSGEGFHPAGVWKALESLQYAGMKEEQEAELLRRRDKGSESFVPVASRHLPFR